MLTKKLKYLVVATTMIVFVGCSSMKSDAKKAASLLNKSIELSDGLKFEKSEKAYLKARKIIDKYIEKDKTTEFYEHFASYRDKEKKQNAK